MATTTERQRVRRYQRRVSRRRFDRRGGHYFDNCHWCGKVIVWYARVPKELRVTSNDCSVAWLLVDGTPTMFALATLDHVTELREGGGVGTENLAPACFECNHLRSAQKSPNERRPCVDGCGRLARKAKKRCVKCENKIAARYQWNPS